MWEVCSDSGVYEMVVFWHGALCSLVEGDQRCPLLMEAVNISETSGNFYQAT